MKAVIRKIGLADISKLIDMEDCAKYTAALRKYKSVRAQTFVCEKDDEIIGFLLTERTLASGVLINYFYIKPQFRGQGIAKQFFNYVRDNHLKKYNDSILCYHHKELTDFYKKLGFIDSSVLRVSLYPPTDYNRAILEKQRDEIQNEAKI